MAAPSGAPAAVKKPFVEQEHVVTEHGTKLYTISGMRFETTAKYAVRKAIGQGAYGLVVSGRDVEQNKPVAIKKIPKAFEDTIDCKRLLREIKILRHFDHANVLGIIDILPPLGGIDTWKDVYIVTELMDTDLHYIIHSKQPLSEEHFKYFLYQILRGVHALHSAHVLHRDLKPGNLLVNKNCDLKICDFGLARAVNPVVEAKQAALTEYVVTRWYRAPELLLENQTYSAAIDVWACGCIFAEMMTRKPLLPGRDYLHQLRLIVELLGTPSEADMANITNEQAVQYLRTLPVKPKRKWADVFPGADKGALDLIDKMLNFNPEKRCTMEEALNHEYLKGLHQGRKLPKVEEVFSFGFDKPKMTQKELRDLIWKEMTYFRSESVKKEP